MVDAVFGNRPIIRPATEADLPYLLSESDAVYMQFLFQSAFEGVKRGEQLVWVAEQEQLIIGQVFVQFTSLRPQLADGFNRAYFYSFRVDPACRGRGVGSQLLETMEADLRRRGFSHITLTVAKTNQRAIELYQRSGYSIVGEEVVHRNVQKVQDRWQRVEEEAWRMEKRL